MSKKKALLYELVNDEKLFKYITIRYVNTCHENVSVIIMKSGALCLPTPAMRLVTWNVNGLRSLGPGGSDFTARLEALAADVVCLQETKVTRGSTTY